MIIVRRLNYVFIAALLAGASPTLVQAQMDPVFTYQGQLKEAGRPFNGVTYLEFTLWDALEDGNQIGSPYWTFDGVPVVNGLFTVEVDAMLFGPTAFNGEPRWLQIVVTDWNYFETVELSPRQAINPAPYALYALDGAGGGSTPWQIDGEDNITYDEGLVGIGIPPLTSPMAMLDVGGDVKMAGIQIGDFTNAGDVLTVDENGVGTWQAPAGAGDSLWQAVDGHIHSPTANVAIGDIEPSDTVTLRIESGPDEYPLSVKASYAAAPWAVYAQSYAPYGVGLYAKTTDLGPSWAVYGETSGSNGWGGYFLGKGHFSGNVGIGTTEPDSPLTVAGLVESTAGGFKFPDGTIQATAGGGGGSSLWSPDATGINYQSGHVGIGSSSTTTESLTVHGSGMRAIRGVNDTPTGSATGVEGRADSTSGRGVYGYAPASSGQATGVLGETGSPDGYGVWGYNDDDSLTGKSIGVYGSSNGTRGIGVKGHVFGSGGAALWGRHDGTGGTGVLAEAGGASGTTYGVNAYVASPTGFGVYAFNEGESGDAVAIYGETSSPTGIAGYFDGRGYFRDNVGIGTTLPGSKLTVTGMVESTSLGFKFPDGSIQTSAATGSGSSLWQTNGNEIYYDADNVGVGVDDPHSTLHVAGGNWDVATGEGDFKIGTWTYRLKMGVATTGVGAGNCRIFAGGPGSKLTLGASAQERLVVTDSIVDVIGTLETDGFKLTDSPIAGYVLKCDALGNGTWQPDGGGGGDFDLPYEGSVAVSDDAFKITNSGTTMNTTAITGIINNAASSDASAAIFRAIGSGMAIQADTDGGTTIYASNSGGGRAVHAISNGDGGGQFTSSKDGGYGVKGQASNTGDDPDTTGGWFESQGRLGKGVYAKTTGTYGDAVYAEASGGEGVAVFAKATGSDGTGIIARGAHAAAKLYGHVYIYEYGTSNKVIELGKGLDYAEGFDVSTDGHQVGPGTVLVIDPEHPGELAISTRAYDRKVAGIVAGAKGLGSGVRLGGSEFDHDVALAGRVYCNVVATDQPIEPGDLLTTSDLEGFAMRIDDHGRAQGAILGKAMEPLAKGVQGQILVLVTLQ